MLNANNKVNYEPKQKEKKYSLSTVLAWLYLKTIGRMLPEKWNQWAKSILHYNIADNVVQTDDLLNSNREKELKDENERLKEKLKEGSKKEENQSNLNQELTKKEKEITKLKEQVKSLGEEKEIFAKFFAAQAQQIEDLELENEELKSKLAGLKKNYSELVKIAQKRGEEFLAQFKEKSEEILHLQKELIECSKEFANKIEMLSVRVEEKDGKIGSLTQLNERLEQEKKEMENKNNAQQQTIFTKDQKIKEQDDLINSFRENKDINQTVKKENKSLRAQNTELKSKFSKLNNESDTKIKELKNQLEEKQAELEQAKKKNTELEDLKQQLEQNKSDSSNKLSAAEIKKKDLESEVTKLQEQAKEKGAELQSLKQQLEKEKTNLNTIEKEKKELEGGVKELKEKLQILEKNSAEIEKQKTDLEKKLESSQRENKKLQKQVEHLSQEREKATSIAISSVENNVETLSETLKNQQIESSIAEDGPQELKEKSNNVDTKLEGIDEKTKAQAKTKEVDKVSTVSIAKSTAYSIIPKSLSKLRGNEDLKNFLSKKNEELKKSFPEFKEKHFCHNVLKETIQSLVYQNGYKFKSDKLLALLKENLVKSGKAIIETKVNKVVEELAKDFVKKNDLKQVIFVERCAEKLYLNEEDSKSILNSFTDFLANRNDSNNDSVKKFVVQKLTEAEMKCFSDKIQGLQLASSIRDKFLSPDQKMCVQTSEENNEYQLTKKAKEKYKLTPNPSMSHTNSTPVSVKQEAKSR
ncbi:hypothetical protein [Wolbachia endosymbiont of Rhagoletis cerasi]|uniref:hypothetical protein n=2 Tax=unclassified Wolbachia TaxID=2640676 RepID=UPI002022CDCE|nr:hypothetical protein [Wolbachia endosymbiont of Rhagoletis cerasi]